MKSFITLLLSIAFICLLTACAGNQAEEKTAAEIPSEQKAEPSEPTVEAAESLPVTDSVDATETEQPEDLGALPKPNSPTDLASSTRTPPARPGKAAAPQSPPTIKSNPNGLPTGYISRKEASLQSAATDDAQKTRAFKQYEGVIILESKMTDESGKPSKFPTWYKVECVDKKQGWVKANCITLN